MVTGGPIRSWLHLVGDDPDSTLAFVSYQARGTLGSQIQKGRTEIPRPDRRDRSGTLQLRVDIETIDGFSGHADRQGLVDFVRQMNSRPENVLCVHGDERSVEDLSSALYRKFDIRTFAPQNLETARFE